MKIIDYLRAKYLVNMPTTITGREALLFGIPYPMQSGWLARFGENEISAATANQLASILRGQSMSNKPLKAMYAARALAALSEAYIVNAENILSAKASKKKLKRERKKNKRRAKSAPPVSIQVYQKPAVHFAVTDDFLQTYEWRRVRMEALKKCGARCQCCGATPADGIVINVDHIKPRRLFPQLALSVDNLQVLCNQCNHGKGNWDMTDWRDAAPELSDEERHMRSIAQER